MNVPLTEFLQLYPTQFDGDSNKMESEQFIDSCMMIGEALGCSKQRLVECVAFRLRGPMRTWYKHLRAVRPSSVPPLRWEEFSDKFREQFSPKAVRDAKAREFEKLKQTSDMTVE